MSLITQRFARVRPVRVACVIGLAGMLALSPAPAMAATAGTLAELERLQGAVTSASETFAEATSRAEELNAQVDEIADEVLHIEQELMPARQRDASRAASDLYKKHSSNVGAVSLLLNAESFEDFLSLSKYLSTIEDAHAAALEELNDLERELNGKLEELSRAKDEANAELERAGAALGEAQSATTAIQQKANAENAAEAEMARRAAEQAAQMQARHEAAQVIGTESSQQGTSQQSGQEHTGGSDGGNQQQSGGGQGSNQDGGDAGGSGQQAPETGGWMTGVASYYGIGDGFMGGTTASGEKVTETSMGIAMLNVPLGTRVEIRYGGRSVIAYVNDRGPYAHGRVIDMQPAVARALNFLSVGVGTVQYRFL